MGVFFSYSAFIVSDNTQPGIAASDLIMLTNVQHTGLPSLAKQVEEDETQAPLCEKNQKNHKTASLLKGLAHHLILVMVVKNSKLASGMTIDAPDKWYVVG